MPAEVKGKVKVTYLDGREELKDVSKIILKGEPIFVEPDVAKPHS